MTRFTESGVEEAALAWLDALVYALLHGPEIATGMLTAERSDPDYRDVILEGRLRKALVRLNPDLPSEAIEDAYRKLTRSDAPSLLERIARYTACWSRASRSSTAGPMVPLPARRHGCSISSNRTTTTGWPSINSP